ncbi:MAG: flagellar basal body rod C-terminal domain-containing protein [Candidatus Avigastranaerophilus sp.]
MTIIGGINYDERGIVQNIRAMRMQTMLMSITNDNVTGFDKVGYQRKIPVVSSFAEFIGEGAISTTTDDTVGRLGLTQNPLDFALADKGYFQILTKDGVKLTRDGRFKLLGGGELVNLEGDKVLSNMGVPIVLPFVPEKIDDVSVDLNGTIRVLDNKSRKFVTAGVMSVVTPDGAAVLNPNVRQGYQEYSNVNLQSEFMQAMQYPKTFEANRQLYMIQNSNLQRAISSLGSN